MANPNPEIFSQSEPARPYLALVPSYDTLPAAQEVEAEIMSEAYRTDIIDKIVNSRIIGPVIDVLGSITYWGDMKYGRGKHARS
jgi:hypothetical protein